MLSRGSGDDSFIMFCDASSVTITTSNPSFTKVAAAEQPAGPAPMTIRSNDFGFSILEFGFYLNVVSHAKNYNKFPSAQIFVLYLRHEKCLLHLRCYQPFAFLRQ